MKVFTFFLVSIMFFTLKVQSQTDTAGINSIIKKAISFNNFNQPDSCLFYTQKALSLSQNINYQIGIARSYSYSGIANMHKGNYPEALQNYFKALATYEILKDKKGILVQYGNIGVVYDNQEDKVKALQYYFKALELAKSVQDTKHTSVQYCNIAIIYSSEKKFADAENYFSKALQIDELRKDEEGICRNLINLGNINLDQGFDDKALTYFIRSLAIAEQIKDDNMVVGNLVNIGSVYSSLKQTKKAEDYFLRSLKVAQTIEDLDLRSQVELIVSEFYSEVKNDDQAFSHYKNYITLRDSIYNEENTKKSVEAELNYQFDKKQAIDKAVHEKQLLILEAENSLQKQWRLFLIIAIALCLLLLFFVKRAYDNKKRIAGFLASESNRKEVLLQEVHHRINNNLQIISSLLSLQANSAADVKLHEYLTQSQNRIQSLSVLHELLYQTDSPLKIDMRDYLNRVLDFHRDVISTLTAKVQIETHIAEISFPTKMAVPIALIVNELVTNSIKYAFNGEEEGKIVLMLFKDEMEKDSWHLRVTDTGNGLPTEMNVRKDSLGLRLVNIMSKQIGGTLVKTNAPGATFDIQFKIII